MRGVYVLVISVSEDVEANVGALGNMHFEKSLYAYVGSAQNSLRKRVERHLRKAKRKFWHIDYLLDNEQAKVVEVFYKKAGKSKECRIAREINKMGVAIMGFGSSDCKCKSHLIKIKQKQFALATLKKLQAHYLRDTSIAM